MHKSQSATPYLLLMGTVLIVGLVWLSLSALPMQAQSAFATNTPEGSETGAEAAGPAVTPVATSDFSSEVVPSRESLDMPVTPIASISNYALRLWLEQDLVNLIFEQIAALDDGGNDAQRALQLTLYELQRRVPGAPTTIATREALIEAMLAAPRGSVDMRSLVRPYIGAVIAEQDTPVNLTYNGFRINMTVARLNTAEGIDAVVHILYPEDAVEPEDVIYEDYLLAIRNPDETFRLLLPDFALPAAPINDVQSLTFQRVGDVNQDGLDELVLEVDSGDINRELIIAGVRGTNMVDLVAPGEDIIYGEIVTWDIDTPVEGAPPLVVNRYEEVSALPDWQCNRNLSVTWTYQSNFYRVTARDETGNLQDSMGCMLYDASLFAMPPRDAIRMIEDALFEYSMNAPDADRALMTIAMLHVTNGDLEQARSIAQALQPEEDDFSWLSRQSTALLEAMEEPGNTILDICESLILASDAPVCNMDSLLERFLRASTFTRERDLVEQLEEQGFPVLEVDEIAEVGRANRTIVSFNLAGSSWWAFAPQRDGTYVIESTIAPEGFEAAVFPQAFLRAPESAYEALLVNDNPGNALNILATLERNNPDVPLAPDALFLRALSLDLTVEREAARQAYFTTWLTYPQSIWGRLAAKHLEFRSG